MKVESAGFQDLAETGSKKVRYRQGGKKGQVTMVACANAVGHAIPPMIVFDAKNLKHSWTNNEVPGSKYGVSDKGWINTDVFGGWLVEHFVVNAAPGLPLTINPRLYVLPKTMTSSCCACHHTPHMKLNLWIAVSSSPSRLSGQMYATSTFRKIPEKSSTNSILICFSLRLG